MSQHITQWVQPQPMNILPHKRTSTERLITAQAGLLLPLQLMNSLGFSQIVDKAFPKPGSNRGIAASIYIKSLIMLQHAGGDCLEDIKLLRDDRALTSLLDKSPPCAKALGDWLRRMGIQAGAFSSLTKVNQCFLKPAFGKRRDFTLDIDATEIVANKREAQWTYNNNKGYMPIIGHIAEVGQVVAYDFRSGNTSPAKGNLEFIKQCTRSLPPGHDINALRIDAAGYQGSIITYCESEGIRYAIRAHMDSAVKELIADSRETDWKPVLNSKGQPIGQDTLRTLHCMSDVKQAFTLVIQRKPKSKQPSLELGVETCESTELTRDGYIYRAIATNRKDMSDWEIIDWYNQRGEDSENRIKELKLDFAGNKLPCSDFAANSFYFGVCVLAYNLFALMRQLSPVELGNARAKSIRFRIYHAAAMLCRSSRRWILRICQQQFQVFEKLMQQYSTCKPPPLYI